MNWTEGSLARHSRRKGWDKDAARQKEYFAKARGRKQEAASGKNTPRVPFVPDYIPREPPAGNSSSSSTHRKKDKSPRKRLIQNQNDTNERAIPSSGHSQPGQRTSGSLLDPTTWTNQHRTDVDIDAKRRKLLQETDWSRIRLQKPLGPIYPQQRAPVAHLTSRGNHHLPGNQANTLLQIPGLDSRLNERPPTHRPRNSMQIRIGDQDLRWSTESNSVRSSVSRRGPPGELGAWHSTPPRSIISRSPFESRPSVSRLSEPSEHPGTDSRPQPPSSDLAAAIGRSLEGRRKRQPNALHDRSIVVTSSPLVMHHPRPTRDGHPFDIYSLEVQDNDSVAARVGSTGPSSSHPLSDDIQWNAWLNETPELETRGSSSVYNEPGSFPRNTRAWGDSDDRSQTHDTIYHGVARRGYSRKSDELSQLSSSRQSFQLSSDVPSENTHATMVELETPKQTRCSRVEEEAWAAFVRGPNQSHELGKSYSTPGRKPIPTIRENQRKASNTQDLMELLVVKEGRQETGHEHRETTLQEDEDEIWKKFIFDDYAEINRRAREEIHEKTKCDLGLKKAIPPSYVLEPASGVKNDQMRKTPTAVAESSSTPCLDLNWNILEPSRSAVEPSPAPKTGMGPPMSQSPNTTVEPNPAPKLDLDTSMLELFEAYELDLSLQIPEFPDSTVELPSAPKPDLSLQTAEVSTDVIEPLAAPGEGQPGACKTHIATEEPSEILSCTDEGMQAPSDAAAETNVVDADSAAAQPGSPQPVQSEFKFHHPSLFVGRLASNGPANMPCAPSTAASKMGRRPRARGSREQGRPDFRTMPDYDGDPIEECCEG
ncbi:hypothetical protein B0J15DRAFT_580069 [Fusarium solani]|uniref:Uncharacterized protein n=1 Tax=Fusarium solani TaxID=169388 RepID=A0A9P9KPY3_FUSSL|nr:uncharacterized protein B0J15DRAFT_580069 [Fusarium solani]KAH7266099.1 hypothetical protein B0J15DRAFT_580069 [Fusarium solani]